MTCWTWSRLGKGDRLVIWSIEDLLGILVRVVRWIWLLLELSHGDRWRTRDGGRCNGGRERYQNLNENKLKYIFIAELRISCAECFW